MDGLEAFLLECLDGRPAAEPQTTCRAFPNPCNPRTTIEWLLPADAAPPSPDAIHLSILDLRGRIVTKITGGRFENGRVRVDWDGTRRGAGPVSSGRYVFVIEAAGHRGRGTVTIVR